jgi:hypothetical protein
MDTSVVASERIKKPLSGYFMLIIMLLLAIAAVLSASIADKGYV